MHQHNLSATSSRVQARCLIAHSQRETRCVVSAVAGEGGNDLLGNKRQRESQQLKRGNKALLANAALGLPVRLLRRNDAPDGSGSASQTVIVYDGLYDVVRCGCGRQPALALTCCSPLCACCCPVVLCCSSGLAAAGWCALAASRARSPVGCGGQLAVARVHACRCPTRRPRARASTPSLCLASAAARARSRASASQ